MTGTATEAGKAARLLATGMVTVRTADLDGRITADVIGDSGATWTVHRTAGGAWACTCPSAWYTGGCSHIAACKLISAG